MKKEEVKMIGLKKVVGETREYLPKRNYISSGNGSYCKINTCGVIHYNRATGELSADFYNVGLHSLNLSPVAEGYARYCIERAATMDEIKDWVYHVNGVPGYEDLEMVRYLKDNKIS